MGKYIMSNLLTGAVDDHQTGLIALARRRLGNELRRQGKIKLV
jgi:hypothetical protein